MKKMNILVSTNLNTIGSTVKQISHNLNVYNKDKFDDYPGDPRDSNFYIYFIPIN